MCWATRVHEPVVFFNQVGIDAAFLAHLANQIQKIRVIVQKTCGLAGAPCPLCFRHGGQPIREGSAGCGRRRSR